MNPFSYSRKLTSYAEQVRLHDYADRAAKVGKPSDSRHRARNRFLLAAVITAMLAVAGYFMTKVNAATPPLLTQSTTLTDENVIRFTPSTVIVSINLSDGTVTIHQDYSPDEAAREFWRSISEEYPKMKREICR